MGCCASTTNSKAALPIKPHPNAHATRHSRQNRAADPHTAQPVVLEEETVKQVLSETPTPKPTLSKFEDNERKKTALIPDLPKIREEDEYSKNDSMKPAAVIAEEVSEESEICSTLSESVYTTTLTEKRDDEDGEVCQRKRMAKGSPARSRALSLSGHLKRERVIGRSPARTRDLSPGKIRIVPSRGRKGLEADQQRKNPVRRRSRSPAIRTDSGGGARTGLSRNLCGKNTGRGESELMETVCNVEDGDGENLGRQTPTTNELLENPPVSLECFIFL